MRLFFFIFLAAAVTVSHAEVIPYETTPGAVASPSYKLTADGKPIFVEKFGDVSYVRFAFSGSAQIQVENLQPIETFSISPQARKIPGTKDGTRLFFPLDQPGGVIVTVNSQEKLLILADPPETDAPKLGDAKVRNLEGFLPPNRDPKVPITAEFQKALDEVSATGGALYLPHGLYVTGQLKIKSNTHVYLQSGALVQAVPDPSPQNFPPQAWDKDSSFIFIGQAQNVKITGRGIIDGNGGAIRAISPEAKIKLLRTAASSQILLDGIFLRDSPRWTVHLLHSDDITCRNLKIVNDLRGKASGEKLKPIVSNTDAFDIDASRKVLVEDSFVYTTDDAFSPKVTGYMNLKRSCKGIVIRRNVLWSLKCAIRIGDETLADLSDILFENNDIIRADRFIGLWCGDACKMSNFRFLDNRAESIGGDSNERFFYFRIRLASPKSKPGTIDHVLVRNFTALHPARQHSTIEGYDTEHEITDVKFENIVIDGHKVESATDIPLDFKNSFYRDITF
ncbi:hypothetical protein BH09VER1_BH09VER1_03720 [soil metagenome]